MDFVSHKLAGFMDSYESYDQIDFQVIPSKMKKLPFFEDDLYLGMQIINVGIVDKIITQQEYVLLSEYNQIERTPDITMAVSALSQMWIYSLYEVLRMWRERKCEFEKLCNSGGIDSKIQNMKSEPMNLTIDTRKKQMLRFKKDLEFREQVESTWKGIEEIFLAIELLRINLAKHCSPKESKIISKSPGSSRINEWCGAMDYLLVEKNTSYSQIDSDRYYTSLNRRDIADSLRAFLVAI